MAVDIGAEAIDREAQFADGYTLINKDHPATVAGLVTSIDIWAKETITGLRVGTFYTINGDTLKCRDSEAIAGIITAGSKVNKVVSIVVEIDDYIGCFFDGGLLEQDLFGFQGLWSKRLELIDPGDQADYTFREGDTISLGGYIKATVTHELVVTDGIALEADTLVKTPIKILSDSIALTDTLIRNPIKTLVDDIKFADVLEKVHTYFRTFTDGIAFTDTLVKSISKVLTDGMAFTDKWVVMWVHQAIRILGAVRNLLSEREEPPV